LIASPYYYMYNTRANESLSRLVAQNNCFRALLPVRVSDLVLPQAEKRAIDVSGGPVHFLERQLLRT
jgi:hypothetical protein